MRASSALLLFVCTLLAACSGNTKGPKYFDVGSIGLRLPALEGWREEAVEPIDPDVGGVVFRLVRDHAIAGSPRIDVVIEPKPVHPTQLEDFLTRNLREMADLQTAGKIQIDTVDQRQVTIGVRRGYRVRHEYVFAGTDMAITQVSTFVVLDGRGIAVTAIGRTELFRPLAEAVGTVLAGIQTPTPDGAGKGPDGKPVPPPDGKPSVTDPIDLGKVGGKR